MIHSNFYERQTRFVLWLVEVAISIAIVVITNGLRLLNLATEYNAGLSGAAANANINLTANEATAGNQTIGSLRIAGANLPISGTDILTDSSGAVLFTTGNQINGPGTLNFGSAEGIIHSPGFRNNSGIVLAVTEGVAPRQ